MAVTGGAFAQSVMTGEVAFGFRSETAANSTLSGMGVGAADITFTATEQIEGLGKVVAAMNLDGSSGYGSGATAGDVTIAFTLTNGVTLKGGSVEGASYLGSGLAAAGSDYDLNMSGKILSARTDNDFVSVSIPLMDGVKVSYSHTEADVVKTTGSALALGTTTQAYDTAGLTYSSGALAADVYVRTYNNQVASTLTSAQYKSRGSVSYDLGVAKIGAGIDTTNYTYGNTNTQSAFGINIPMGALSVGGQLSSVVTSGGTSNYSRSGVMVGGKYDFSKRTYAVAQYYNYDAGSTVSNTSGYRFVVYNTF